MFIQTPNLSPHHHLFLLVTISLFSVSVGLFLSCKLVYLFLFFFFYSRSHVQSVVSDFMTPWTVACQVLLSGDSPGKNTGVGCHALLQWLFLTQRSNLGLLHCRQILYYLSHQGSPLSSYNLLESGLYLSFPAMSRYHQGLATKYKLCNLCYTN